MPMFQLGSAVPKLPPVGMFWIAPTAAVIGDVRLSIGSSIWFGAVVRGDNDPILIGEDSNIQDGCILHSDPGIPLRIGDGVTVGHNAVLHGCDIGDNCLIGMGSIILNGARIGSNCLIGAGTLVTEGKTFPENSVVMGSPGRVVRQMTPEEIAKSAASARSYCAKWRKYKANLV